MRVMTMGFLSALRPHRSSENGIKRNICPKIKRNSDDIIKQRNFGSTPMDIIAPTNRLTMIGNKGKITQQYQRHWYIVALICVINLEFGLGNLAVDDNNTFEILDVFATVVPFDEDTLQSHIKWNLKNVGDHTLDVRINSIPSDDCSVNPCVAYGIKSAVHEILLPEDPMPLIDHPECSIRPNCSYNVTVESADRTVQKTIELLVPDCVGKICSCKHAITLPPVSLNATLEDNRLKLSWNISNLVSNNETVKLESLRMSVGILNNPLLTWGGRYQHVENIHQTINTVNNSLGYNGSYYVNITKTIADGMPNAQFLIRAHVIDWKGCSGKDSNITYVVHNKKYVPRSTDGFPRVVWFILLVAMCFVAVSALFAWQYIKRVSRKDVLADIRNEIYQIIPLTTLRPSITFRENDIYRSDAGSVTGPNCIDNEDSLEIPHSQLNIGRNIGKGAFGSVYFAYAENFRGEKRVEMAVKKLRSSSSACEMDDFYDEIAMMKSLPKHPNIIGLIGYCTAKKPILMVMEFCSAGDLLQYLRNLRNIHEVCSVIVSDNANSALQASNATDISRRPISYYNIQNHSSVKYINETDKSPNETQRLLSSETECKSDKDARPAEMVGQYLELIHSPKHDSSLSLSDSDDISSTTKVESIVSMDPTSNLDAKYLRCNGNSDALSSRSAAASMEYVLDNKDLQSFALQIARGMSHLEERGIVHRDLAARNILITHDKVLKISDFGLSRNGVYINMRHKKVPVRWLAVETLRHRIHSIKSDVWSYGIVLWEIGTLGGMPYPNICNSQILDHLESGYRMQRPEVCSEDLYKLMRQCWSANPDDRPFFQQIVEQFEAPEETATATNPIYVNFDQLASNYIFPPTNEYEKARTDFT